MKTIGTQSEQTEERLTISADQKSALDQHAIVAITDVHGTCHFESTGDYSLTILLGKDYA
jgi:hypothetical protein